TTAAAAGAAPTHRRGTDGESTPAPEEKKSQLLSPSPWSALPLDLASLVLSLLPMYADRACFAAVCPQWRAAARQLQIPPLPLLALPDGTFYSLMYDKPFRFPGCGFAGYENVCGSWLVFSRDDGCFMVNPFSRATVTLPALSSVRLRPPNASAKSKWAEGGSVESANLYITWMRINKADNLRISKLILCSPNLVAALVGIGPFSQILMCQPGALSWSVRAYDRIEDFQDMSFFQGKLYAIAKDENLLVVNISQDHSTGDPQVCRIGRVIEGDCPPWYYGVFEDNSQASKKLYLVESGGMLLMVRRTIWCQFPEPGTDVEIMGGQNEFEVFEADFEHSRWVKVLTLGDDQVLFLGRRCSRSMSVSQYGLPGDCIFFLDDDEDNCLEYAYDEENSSFGVYSMRFRSIHSGDPNISWKRCAEMYLAAWLFPEDR
uniref:KIB1-4 beta-propeller domain-containing protein n=1 Tax=Aegilops tauschii subsp. strangulata TaxID=200361 RepID=A0A452ZWY2_AEGTS